MPEGGGDNLPTVVSRIKDPVKKAELRDKTSELMAIGLSGDPIKKKDGGQTVASRAEIRALRDMGKAAHARRQRRGREVGELLSSTDYLTGIPNRRAFFDALFRDVAHSQRTGEPLGVLFLDIDDFKAYNESMTHQGGDVALIALAEELVHRARREDLVARLGGDEFVVICRGADAEHTKEIGDRLRLGVEQGAVTEKLAIKITIGAASMPMENNHLLTAEDLLRAADVANQYGKTLPGKDRVIGISEVPPNFTPKKKSY